MKIRQKENQPSQIDLTNVESLPPGVRKDAMSNTGESWATYGAALLGTTAAIKYPMAALTVLGAPTNVKELQLDLLEVKSGQLPNRLRARAVSRIAGVVDEVFDPVKKWTRDKVTGAKNLLPNPFKVGEFASSTGTGFGPRGVNPPDGSVNLGPSGKPLRNTGGNPYLTYAERKGISPIPSKKELIRREKLGSDWQLSLIHI